MVASSSTFLQMKFWGHLAIATMLLFALPIGGGCFNLNGSRLVKQTIDVHQLLQPPGLVTICMGKWSKYCPRAWHLLKCA